jgi:hypothetical protein
MLGNIGFKVLQYKVYKVKKKLDVNIIKTKLEHLKKFVKKFAIWIFRKENCGTKFLLLVKSKNLRWETLRGITFIVNFFFGRTAAKRILTFYPKLSKILSNFHLAKKNNNRNGEKIKKLNKIQSFLFDQEQSQQFWVIFDKAARSVRLKGTFST